MKITIEFTGLAKDIVRQSPVLLNLPDQATYRDLIRHLSTLFPKLVGLVFSADRNDLLNANIFSRNGEEIILADLIDTSPQDGDHLLLLSVIVGGSSDFQL